MRKSYRKTLNVSLSFIASTALLGLSQASAQVTTDINGTPIILPSTSSSFNQNGFNLPSLPTVAGQDIVRGSSGLSCHSGLGNSGPNFDMGLIGSNDIFSRESVSVYGRVTVPLGKRPKRVDCTKLYDLEIAKLKMELQLLRAGAFPGMLDENTARAIVTQLPPVETPETPPKEQGGFSATLPEKSVQNKLPTTTPLQSSPVQPVEIGDVAKAAPTL